MLELQLRFDVLSCEAGLIASFQKCVRRRPARPEPEASEPREGRANTSREIEYEFFRNRALKRLNFLNRLIFLLRWPSRYPHKLL